MSTSARSSTSTSTSNSASMARPNHNNGPPGRDPNRPNPNRNRNIRGNTRRAKIYFCPSCGKSSPNFGAWCTTRTCEEGYYVLIAPLGPEDAPYVPEKHSLTAWCDGCNEAGTFLGRCSICEGYVHEEPPHRYYRAFRRHYDMEVSDSSSDEDSDEEDSE